MLRCGVGLHARGPYLIWRIITGLMCTSLISFHSRRSPLCSSYGDLVVPRTRLRLGNRAFSVAGPAVWNSLPTDIRSAPTLCSLHLQESTQDSFVFTVVYCTLSFINLIRVAYVVRRPCSDFTDMLRRHINCRIIIIIII